MEWFVIGFTVSRIDWLMACQSYATTYSTYSRDTASIHANP